MSKVITSPIDEFAGTVELYDPIPLLACSKFTKATGEAQGIKGAAEYCVVILPGVLACVKKWDIANIPLEAQTAETFPGSPLAPTIRLLTWLVTEINKLLFRPPDAPNA